MMQPIRARFSTWQLTAMLLAFLACVPMRFLWLDQRPLMHDESLFAYYSLTISRNIVKQGAGDEIREATMRNWREMKKFAEEQHQAPPPKPEDAPPERLYEHLPILHGPTMLFCVGWLYRFFGDSIGLARGFIAVMSIIALLCAAYVAPLRLRAWALLGLLASPTLLFYSRFFRNEMIFNAFAMSGMALWIMGRHGGKWRWGALGAAPLVAILAIKENALFIQASALTFWAVWIAHRFLPLRYLRRLIRPVRIGEGFGRKKKKGKDAPPTPDEIAIAREMERRNQDFYRPEEEPIDLSNAGADPSGRAVASNITVPQERGDIYYTVRLGRNCGWRFWCFAGLGVFLGTLFVAFIYSVTAGADARAGWDEFVARHPLMKHDLAGPITHFFYDAIGNLRETWEYWAGQHKEYRLSGALHYYVPIMIIYELPMLLLLYVGLAADALRHWGRLIGYALAFVAWDLIYRAWVNAAPQPWWADSMFGKAAAFLHLEPGGSIYVLGLMIAPLLAWSVWMIWERRGVAAWCGWWAACSLFQYSTAGEKVPWLTVHILIPFYLAAAWVWAVQLRRTPRPVRIGLVVFGAMGLFLAFFNDVRLIGSNAADPSERLVFNHTTPEFDAMCKETLREWEMSAATIPPEGRVVICTGEPAWPNYWYFRDQTMRQDVMAGAIREADLVIVEQGTLDADLLRTVGVQGHAAPGEEIIWKEETIPLRRAWLNPWPYEEEAKDDNWMQYIKRGEVWSAWCKYFWTRETWTKKGDQALLTVLRRIRTRD